MGLLELLIVILLVCWMLGFGFHVAGGLVHILLVIVFILIIVRLLQGRSVL